MSRANLIIGALLFIILILLYFLILRKPVTVVEPFDDTELRKEIAEKDSIANYWQEQSKVWENVADSFEAKSDSLEKTKTVIKHHYHEIYRTLPHASNQQLDSILRANW